MIIWFTLAVILVTAMGIGVSIYNKPENQLARQLRLGYRFLENQQYEEAVVAFERAIQIDKRCLEAYVGGIEAHLHTGDAAGTRGFYDRALSLVRGMDETSLENSADEVGKVYLYAGEVYGEGTEQEAGILEEGLQKTGNDARVKEQLIEKYLLLGKRYTESDLYKKALEVYDRLLELNDGNDSVMADFVLCIHEYVARLMETGDYEEIKSLAEKYEMYLQETDLRDALDEINREEEKRRIEEEGKARLEEEKRHLEEEQENEQSTEDSQAQRSGYTDDELIRMAYQHYADTKGYRVGYVNIDHEVDGVVSIQLYDDMGDHTATSDWYAIDRNTGKGTNILGEEVDLTPYYVAD